MHGIFHQSARTHAMYMHFHTDNNHIKVIEGLNNNIKLNVLSLGIVVNIQLITKLRRLRIWVSSNNSNVCQWVHNIGFRVQQNLQIKRRIHDNL